MPLAALEFKMGSQVQINSKAALRMCLSLPFVFLEGGVRNERQVRS